MKRFSSKCCIFPLNPLLCTTTAQRRSYGPSGGQPGSLPPDARDKGQTEGSSTRSSKIAGDESSPSLFLRHIHLPVSQLNAVYRQNGAGSGLPADPNTREESEELLRFICAELNMGLAAVRIWRCGLWKKILSNWDVKQKEEMTPDAVMVEQVEVHGVRDDSGLLMNTAPEVEHIARGVPQDVWETEAELGENATNDEATKGQDDRRQDGSQKNEKEVGDELYFYPRPQDKKFIHSCLKDIKAVLSPFVTLSPPPMTQRPGAASLYRTNSRPTHHENTSTLYATQYIPPGMFIASIPAAAGVYSDPARDAVISPRTYFQQVEDIIEQLLEASGSALEGYTDYLKESVVPCRNLPFIKTKEDLFSLLQPYAMEACKEGRRDATEPKEKSVEEEVACLLEESAAYALWKFFHETLGGAPLSPVLRKYFLGEETGGDNSPISVCSSSGELHGGIGAYRWWVSLVLSRRIAGYCMMPLLDKFNHSPLPNCMFTMSNPVFSSTSLLDTVTGLDVFHNIISGVPLLFTYEPYVHVFTIRDVYPGESLTLSYQSPSHHLYPPAPAGRRSHSPQEPHNPPRTTQYFLRNAEALRLFRNGRQDAATLEGQGSWQLQWGFAPEHDAVFSDQDLEEMGCLLAEKRVEERRVLFPGSSC